MSQTLHNLPMYIALVADRTGRYTHVWGEAKTWGLFHDQLEDVGCEVIENQTYEWYGCTKEEVAEDCLSVHQLLTHSDFVPHP
jgi:hypothetical protein